MYWKEVWTYTIENGHRHREVWEMYWKEVWTYTIEDVYQCREVWEMVEETNNDENEFTCMNCNCKLKTI